MGRDATSAGGKQSRVGTFSQYPSGGRCLPSKGQREAHDRTDMFVNPLGDLDLVINAATEELLARRHEPADLHRNSVQRLAGGYVERLAVLAAKGAVGG